MIAPGPQRADQAIPYSKVHGANVGPIWGRQDPGGPHVGPTYFAIWDIDPIKTMIEPQQNKAKQNRVQVSWDIHTTLMAKIRNLNLNCCSLCGWLTVPGLLQVCAHVWRVTLPLPMAPNARCCKWVTVTAAMITSVRPPYLPVSVSRVIVNVSRVATPRLTTPPALPGSSVTRTAWRMWTAAARWLTATVSMGHVYV